MFKVVWKSFRYNRKNFLSFFMSEILSVAVIFMLIYIQEALSQVPGIKTEAFFLGRGEGGLSLPY